MDVSVVIPTYNEAENLPELVPRLFRALEEAGMEGEIVVADDGSPDGTADLADRLMGGGDTTNNNMGGVTIVIEGAGDPEAVADAVYDKQLAISDDLGRGNPYRG